MGTRVRIAIFTAIILFVALSIPSYAASCLGNPTDLLHTWTDTTTWKSAIDSSTFLNYAKGLFAALLTISVFMQFLDYLAGRLDIKGALTRILVISVLLNSYAATDNFRYVIRDGANNLGIWMRGGAGPEALLSNIGQIFSGAIGTNKGEGIFPGMWDSFETSARLIFTIPGWITVIFVFTSCLVAIMSYVIDAGQLLLLFMLDVIGPFCLAFGVFVSTQKIAWGWALRWLEICLWPVIYSAFMFAIIAGYKSILAYVPIAWITNPLTEGKCNLLAMFLSIVLGVVSLFMLVSVPSMASSIVGGRSSGFYRGVSLAVGFVPVIIRSYVTRGIKKI